jgi:hypothetical protein
MTPEPDRSLRVFGWFDSAPRGSHHFEAIAESEQTVAGLALSIWVWCRAGQL